MVKSVLSIFTYASSIPMCIPVSAVLWARGKILATYHLASKHLHISIWGMRFFILLTKACQGLVKKNLTPTLTSMLSLLNRSWFFLSLIQYISVLSIFCKNIPKLCKKYNVCIITQWCHNIDLNTCPIYHMCSFYLYTPPTTKHTYGTSDQSPTPYHIHFVNKRSLVF